MIDSNLRKPGGRSHEHRQSRTLVRALSSYALGLCVMISSPAAAYDFGYQGRLTEPSGKPVSGPVDLRISFYHDANGGSAVYTQEAKGVSLQEGLFSITLSISNSDYHNIFPSADKAVFLEATDLTHDANAPYPRQRIGMLPLAGKVPVDNTTLGFNSENKLTILFDDKIDKIQGRSVSSSAPTTGQVLQWNGASWALASTGIAASSISNSESKTEVRQPVW